MVHALATVVRKMSAIPPAPSRLCPVCSVPEPIEAGERVWPLDWRCRNCGHHLPVQNGIPMLAPEVALECRSAPEGGDHSSGTASRAAIPALRPQSAPAPNKRGIVCSGLGGSRSSFVPRSLRRAPYGLRKSDIEKKSFGRIYARSSFIFLWLARS